MSKFDKVFEAREEKQQDKESGGKPSAKSSSVKSKPSKPAKQNNSSAAKMASESSEEVTVAAESSKPEKQRGRPKAKRSDPAFICFTTYIRKDTHLKVKIALLQEGEGREMSELVEELLVDWSKNK